MFTKRTFSLIFTLVLTAAVVAPSAHAQKKYDTGASDTEIKIGQTMPYSGPASSYGTIGKSETAFIKMINEQGGVNGRKINLISLDDGYTPPKAVEQVRRLVEQDQVLFLWQNLGTPTNSAFQKYVNNKKVPHLFLATGATKWGDPKNYPWTIGGQPTYQAEGAIYAKHVLKTKPDAKIAILYQNDDYGKDYVKGLKDGLKDKAASLIVAEASYETAEPSIDSQVIKLRSSGANTFFIFAIPKFAAQAIRKAHDSGWKPLAYINNVSAGVAAVLEPAGLDKSVGLLSAVYLKDSHDPQWANAADVKRYLEFMKKYFADGDPKDYLNAYGFMQGTLLVNMLKACGDNLTRENIMKQATSLKNVELPMLLPGIKIDTSADDYFIIEQLQMARFDGKEWKLFGDLLDY